MGLRLKFNLVLLLVFLVGLEVAKAGKKVHHQVECRVTIGKSPDVTAYEPGRCVIAPRDSEENFGQVDTGCPPFLSQVTRVAS